MWIGDWLRLWENESEDPSRKESIIIHQFSGDEAIICWSCSGALANVTRTQCLPPDVWGPTQMLNINIIQCNWTSVIKYTELRASGELTCSTLLQMDWEWQRGNLISWMSTKLPTALALWIYGGSIHAHSAWAKYILTNIQCPVLNSYSSLHAGIWRLMPRPSCPRVWGTRLFSVTSLERRNPSLLNWNIQQTTDHLGIHDQGLSMVIWIGPNKIEEQGKLPV